MLLVSVVPVAIFVAILLGLRPVLAVDATESTWFPTSSTVAPCMSICHLTITSLKDRHRAPLFLIWRDGRELNSRNLDRQSSALASMLPSQKLQLPSDAHKLRLAVQLFPG